MKKKCGAKMEYVAKSNAFNEWIILILSKGLSSSFSACLPHPNFYVKYFPNSDTNHILGNRILLTFCRYSIPNLRIVIAEQMPNYCVHDHENYIAQSTMNGCPGKKARLLKSYIYTHSGGNFIGYMQTFGQNFDKPIGYTYIDGWSLKWLIDITYLWSYC